MVMHQTASDALPGDPVPDARAGSAGCGGDRMRAPVERQPHRAHRMSPGQPGPDLAAQTAAWRSAGDVALGAVH